ncbi:MAG: bifunctional phosphopantothenoylcysteine decarboxylase/phosphopantothenate--cysteine ligase CoaBC [Candidatus Porifericomitaceae bacterium WSBS_2022_MAG_OTU9]
MMRHLTGKHILLGVTGGIAAYKTPELVRLLCADGAEVRVIISDTGTDFVTPITMQAVSGHPVLQSGKHTATASNGMDHIALARWCDAMLICPATANSLAKLAHGIADDLLTTTALATTAPIMVAPAMNHGMWQHPATQANMHCLRSRHVAIAGPGIGAQACGEEGPGRMLEPTELLEHGRRLFHSAELHGRKLLVTTGSTKEYIDPVRYMTNRSSGIMGQAVAIAAREAGADVLLIAGETTQAAPDGMNLERVTTAAEMRRAVLDNIAEQDIYIGVAAVCDYRCREPATSKIKRADQSSLNLELQANPDIIAELGTKPGHPFLVGFAAETDNLLTHAKTKLQQKGIDMIVANKVGANAGFGDVENELFVIWHDGHIHIAEANKQKLARNLMPIIAAHYKKANHANTNH